MTGNPLGPDEDAQLAAPSEGISWGKVLLGAAAVTGIAVAGVGLFGDKLATALGPESAVGGLLKSGHDKIGAIGASIKGLFTGDAAAAGTPAVTPTVDASAAPTRD